MDGKTYTIVDATITKTEARFRGLAAKYIEWEILNNGAKLADNPSDADYVLVTVVSPHEYECVPRALKRLKIKPFREQRTSQKVILGGQGATSPTIFNSYIDVACVGEGRLFLQTLVKSGYDAACKLPNAWIPDESKQVSIDEDFPWDAPPTMAEDGVVRVYASRSCKKKCLFCHTGWQTSYRENDSTRLMDQYDKLINAGYRVNVVTNDAPALSFFDEMTALEHFSASYSQTRELIADKRNIKSLLGKVRNIRFGVESPSTRLRRLIGKPIETDALFDLSVTLLNSGVGVRWFMIAGLPGENDSDYDELKEIVRRARHEITKGALQLSFTAFCPDSAAPLCIAPLDDLYWDRFQDFWKYFFEGDGFTRKIQLFKCAAPEARLRHAIGSMGATEDEIRRGWLEKDPPNWRINYTYKHLARRAYNVYARRVGLPIGIENVT